MTAGFSSSKIMKRFKCFKYIYIFKLFPEMLNCRSENCL